MKKKYGTIVPEAGCDEAGRGCLAGPVVAAAVILPPDPHPDLCGGLRDSKVLTEKRRDVLRTLIRMHAVSFAVASVEADEIDNTNILEASIRAMHKALDQLEPQPGMILVDGNRFHPYRDIPHKCIVRGDATYLSVAAASILAKTTRDALMRDLHNNFPQYQWMTNKGYPTPAHRGAISLHGLSPHHRRSFTRKIQWKLSFSNTMPR